MEIKDALSLYNFLGELDYIGGALFSLVISIVVVFIILRDKLDLKSSKTISTYLPLTLVIFVCIFSLVCVSISRNQKKEMANIIKSYLTTNNIIYYSYENIATHISLSDDDLALKDTVRNQDFLARINKIKRVVGTYPQEFTIQRVYDGNIERVGVKLVDTNAVKAIKNNLREVIPYYKKVFVEYAKAHQQQAFSYADIYNIDNRFNETIIDGLILRYDNLFIPVSNNGIVDSIKINRDSLAARNRN